MKVTSRHDKIISRKIDITINVKGDKGDFCDDSCIFRSFYIESFCKLFKRELFGTMYDVIRSRKRIIDQKILDVDEAFTYPTVYYSRCDECKKKFGMNFEKIKV
jgi:hypothetical protein